MDGRLLHESRVLPETHSLKDVGLEDSAELQYLSLFKASEGETLTRNELLLLPDTWKG